MWDMLGPGGYLQGMSDLAAIIFMVLIRYDEGDSTKWLEAASPE